MSSLSHLDASAVFSSWHNLKAFFHDSPAVNQVLAYQPDGDQTVVATGVLETMTRTKNNPNHTLEAVKAVYLQTISEHSLRDPRVKSRVCIRSGQVGFRHDKGICGGEVKWFIYLYHRTKSQFGDNVHEQMRALGKQFEEGGGVEPLLLQSILLKKGKLLDFKFGAPLKDLKGTGVLRGIYLKIRSSQPIGLIHKTVEILASNPNEMANPSDLDKMDAVWKKPEQELIRQLQDLPGGTWYIRLFIKDGRPFNHGVGYVRVGSELGYYFDPNFGIIAIHGSEQGRYLYPLMNWSAQNCGFLGKSEMIVFPVVWRNEVDPLRAFTGKST